MGVKTVFYAMQHYVQPCLLLKACNDHTREAQKQKSKVLYSSIGRLDVVLSVPIVPVHQDEHRKNAPRRQSMVHCIHER